MKNYKIKESTAELWFKSKASLGEGPVWIEDSEELLWVDINEGEVHAKNAKTKEDRIIYQGENTSCIVPVSKKEVLIALTNKIVLLNTETNKSCEFVSLEFNTSNIRFNDGKVDPNGNFWIGTMEKKALPNKGILYMVDSNKKVSIKVKNVTISNGLAWSLDQKTMYFIDTIDHVVYAYDFNKKSEISNQRVVIEVSKELGYPDGMTIDSKGNLWIAMWGGFSVICFNPKSGQILKKVDVQIPYVTSCTFGGKHMDTLFITTARKGLSASQLRKYPNSGSIFYIKTDVKGVNVNYFNII